MLKVARILLVALGLVLAACSSDGTDSEESPEPTTVPTVRPGQHGPIASGEFSFEGVLDLTGKYTVLYSFNDEKADTCAKIAGSDATGYVVPLPTFHKERRFVWTAAIRDYNGPGTYDLEDLGRVSVGLLKTQDAETIEYSSDDGATVELEVDDKNAGSFAFKDLANDEGETISGRADWDCREGSEGDE